MFCFLVFLQGGNPCGGGPRESSLWTARDDDLSPTWAPPDGFRMESFFFAVPVVYALKNANRSVKANSNRRFHPVKTVSEMGKISVDQSWPDCARVTDKLSNPFFPGFCRLYNAKQDPVPCK